MFGYIRPLKAELLVREYEQYRGVYCALCKSIGKRYGAIARMALSYDGTFLALVQLAGAPDCPGFQRMRCVVNPLKKCTFCTAGDEAFAMAAAFSVISAYWEIRDDLTDAGWFGKLRAAAVWPFAAAAHRKVRRAYPQLEALVDSIDSGFSVFFLCHIIDTFHTHSTCDLTIFLAGAFAPRPRKK